MNRTILAENNIKKHQYLKRGFSNLAIGPLFLELTANLRWLLQGCASARLYFAWLASIPLTTFPVAYELFRKLDFANFWVYVPKRAFPQLFTFLGRGILPVPSKFNTLNFASL